MKALLRLVSWFAFAAVAACGGGGGTSSPGSVTGAIKGQQFKILDAVSSPVTLTDPQTGMMSTQAQVILTTTADYCADLTMGVQQKDMKLIALALADITSDTMGKPTTIVTPTAPGRYLIVPPNPTSLPAKAGLWNASVTDDACLEVTANGARATGGTITLKSIKSGVFSGSFDVTLDSGDHISGGFSPEECPSIQAAIDATSAPPCM
jgi:hypothetical protein